MNNITRVLTGVIGFPIVALFLVFGNETLIDVAFAIIAVMSLHEYYKAFKSGEKANPVTWIGYISCALIATIHVIPNEYIINIIGILMTMLLLILFFQGIITNMKTNIIDIAVTILGICYIPLFIMFIPLLRGAENGQFLVWYIILSAWGTDVFAFTVGKLIGKHKFTKISPHKTIEGCIGGILGSVIINLVYTVIVNSFFQLGLSYINIAVLSATLSVLSQLGDLTASSIKRYVGIKDFSNLLPGHGGMLDRIDSLIFIAPFAFYLLKLFA